MAAEEAMVMTLTYEIVSRDVPTQRVATIRERVQMTAIGQAMGEGFGEVARAAEAAGAEIDGLPFAIYHEVGPDEVEVELGTRRKLERERVTAQVGGMRLAKQGSRWDAAALLHGRKHLACPGLLQLRELEAGRPDGHGDGDGLRLRLGLRLRDCGLFRTWLGI